MIRKKGVLLFVAILIVVLFQDNRGYAKPTPEKNQSIRFSGMNWEVNSSNNKPVNPGRNYFSSGKDSVWVDEQGWLHLKIHGNRNLPKWVCASIHSIESAKYGVHRFQVIGRLGSLDKNIVLGLFLYQSAIPKAGTLPAEIDFEFSTWGYPKYSDKGEWIPSCSNAQTVLWPAKWNNISVKPADIRYYFIHSPDWIQTTHDLCWKKDSISFQSYWFHDNPPREENLIFSYSVSQKQNPRAYFPVFEDNMKIHMNLWLNNDTLLPSDGEPEEILVKYEYIP